MANSFVCSLITPSAAILDAVEVSYVDLPAHDGQMGIANAHAPALVKLGAGVLTLELTDGKKEKRIIVGGIAQIENNSINLLTDEVYELDQIDSEKVAADLQEALAIVATDEQSVEQKNRAVAKGRALVAATAK